VWRVIFGPRQQPSGVRVCFWVRTERPGEGQGKRSNKKRKKGKGRRIPSPMKMCTNNTMTGAAERERRYYIGGNNEEVDDNIERMMPKKNHLSSHTEGRRKGRQKRKRPVTPHYEQGKKWLDPHYKHSTIRKMKRNERDAILKLCTTTKITGWLG